MSKWFDSFAASLRSEALSSDLIGAGKASAEDAMAHYRFQHQQKIKEAVESSFPALLEQLKDQWPECWKAFWNTHPGSPRSLDFYPDVFLNNFLASNVSQAMKDLASFERQLEIFAWEHKYFSPCEIQGLSETSRLELIDYKVLSYTTDVIGSYQNKETCIPQKILIWLNADGVQFKSLHDWELKVLSELPQGLGLALESAPEDQSGVTNFFGWLASSGLVKKILLR
jgi:hypothetical protein